MFHDRKRQAYSRLFGVKTPADELGNTRDCEISVLG